MWWFDSTCGCNSSDQDSHRFFPNVLGDTKKIPGERQRLVVLRRTVNPFPRGKHWRFNSSFAHLGRLQPIHREFTGRERLLCGELQEPGYDFLWLRVPCFQSKSKNHTCSISQAVKIPPFHGGDGSSILPSNISTENNADCLQLV